MTILTSILNRNGYYVLIQSDTGFVRTENLSIPLVFIPHTGNSCGCLAASNVIWLCFCFVLFCFFSVLRSMTCLSRWVARACFCWFLVFPFVSFRLFLLRLSRLLCWGGAHDLVAYPPCVRLGVFCVPLCGLPLLLVTFSGVLFPSPVFFLFCCYVFLSFLYFCFLLLSFVCSLLQSSLSG